MLASSTMKLKKQLLNIAAANITSRFSTASCVQAYNQRDNGSGSRYRNQDEGRSKSNRYNGRDNYDNRDNYNRSGGYSNNYRGNSRGSGRGFDRDRRNSRGKFDNRQRKSYDDDAAQDNLIRRTKGNKTGPEGDGLLGGDNYEVNREALVDFEWHQMKEDIPEGHTIRPGFSGIPVLSLAKHKLVSRVLANSLRYNRKYEELTSVQAQSLLPILKGDSVIVRAKTGTGKTAAFATPTLQEVLEAKRRDVKGVKAVIISPTRELAQQIADEIHQITQYGELRKIRTQCFVGGLSKSKQLEQGFERNGPVDIVVATPGRLLDILQDPFIIPHFASLQVKILDEADRLLDIGFRSELDKIRDCLDEATGGMNIPTLLFSATIDKRVRDFAQAEFGGRAKVVDTVPKDEPEAQELVEQEALLCESWADVYRATLESIQKEVQSIKETEGKDFKAIIFLPTVKLVDHFQTVVSGYFARDKKMSCNAIHGQLTQAARQRVSDSFRRSKEAILITTDVIARGMDFPLVTHVFQMGSPSDAASYVHRIGRSARAGHSGKSILVMDKRENNYITDILARANIKNIKVANYEKSEEFDEEKFEDICRLDDEQDANQIYNSMLSAGGQNRNMLSIPAKSYIDAQESFQHLIGLEYPRLSGGVRDLWASKRFDSRAKPRGRGSFGGGSRKTRMRW